ncbi:MAG: cytochrome b/b6 domain-containing protein [Rhodovibrionaceae bacterium]
MTQSKTRAGRPAGAKKLLVWDLPTRLFHWALVGLIAFSYATAELDVGSMELHTYSGFAILALIIFRIAWGFLGPRNARFFAFLRPLSETLAYARDLARGREKQYPGHNPLGALSVIALLTAIGLQVLTGLFADDDILTQGPLSVLISPGLRDEFTDLHENIFNVVVALIALHLLAVAFHSFVKREPLIRAMITGRKPAGSQTQDGPAAKAGPGIVVTLWGLVLLAAAAAAAYAIVEVLPGALS